MVGVGLRTFHLIIADDAPHYGNTKGKQEWCDTVRTRFSLLLSEILHVNRKKQTVLKISQKLQ